MLFLYVFLSDCKCLENTIRKEIGFCILISLGKIIWTFTVVYFGCKKKKKKKKDEKILIRVMHDLVFLKTGLKLVI